MASLISQKISGLYLVLVSALLLGRLSGFLRDVFIAKTLGVGRTSDFFLAVLQFPDFLAGLLLVSGLNGYLIPKLQSASESERASLMGQTTSQVVILFVCLAFVLVPLSSNLGQIIVPGLMPLDAEENISFKVILAVTPIAAISGVFSVWLIFRQRMFFGGLGTLIVNGLIILSVMMASIFGEVFICITAGLALGLVSRAWFLWSVASRSGMQLRGFGCQLELPSGQLIFVAFSLSAINVFPLVVRSLGSNYGEGYVSILSIAIKLIELPLTVGLASFGLVSLSLLSDLYRGSGSGVSQILRKSLHFAALLGMGAGLLLLLCGWYLGPLAAQFLGYTTEQEFNFLEIVSIGSLFLPVMGRCLVMISDTSARQDYVAILVCVASSVCVSLSIAVFWAGESPVFLVVIWGGMFGLTCLLLECRRCYLRGPEGLYTPVSVGGIFLVLGLIAFSLS